MKYKAIIFDFDGVLVDSVNIKTQAFAKLYAPYGEEIVKQVIEYHLEHGGVSRFNKFKYYHESLLNIPFTAEIENQLANEFANYVQEAVITAAAIAGADFFLQQYYQEIPFFIASATPENELLTITEKRNMQKYFVGIFGSPATKSEIISNILNKYNYLSKQVLMIGDSKTDYEAAMEAKVPFIGISNDANYFPLALHILPDLKKLALYI